MKRHWNRLLPLTLVLVAAPAMAMELGPIRVESTLDSPLLAEIPIVEDYPGEANGLKVTLASADQFAQAGIRRADLRTPLKFRVVGHSGNKVIRITSTRSVRVPFLDMLLKVTWPKGKLLREYTVLLDPAGSHWQSAAVAASPAAGNAQPASGAVPANPSHATGSPSQANTPAGTRITVHRGDTLSAIARNHPMADVGQKQMLMALKTANPDAFFENNINALKAGVVMRMPTRQEALKLSKRAAELAVARENRAWRNQQAPAIATGTRASASKAAPATSPAGGTRGDHLSLVPPAKAEGAAAGAATAGAGTSVKDLRQALARSKEALSSQTQHATDLQSRVTALEGLQKKTQQLLSLKNAEIATLREELAKARKQAGLPQPAATGSVGTVAAAATPAATPETTAKASAVAGATTAATTAVSAGAADTTALAGASKPATASSAAPGTGAGSEVAAASAAVDVSATATTAAKPVAATTAPRQASTQATAATTAQAAQADETGTEQAGQQESSTQPVASPAKPTQAAKAETAATKVKSSPAVATAAAATPAAKAPASKAKAAAPKDEHHAATVATHATHASRASATPWYEELWARLVLGLVVVLLIVAWAITRRRPRDVLVGPGVADEPITPTHDGDDAATTIPAVMPGDDTPATDDGEGDLLRQLAANPEDVGLHLELASLYYARGDVDHFEAVAESMHAYLDDDTQPEWQEVRKMGRELAPDHPLFVDVPAPGETAFSSVEGDAVLEPADDPDLVLDEPPADPAGGEDAPMWHFVTEATPAAAHADEADDLPPLDMDDEFSRVAPPDEPEAAATHAGDAPDPDMRTDVPDDLLDDAESEAAAQAVPAMATVDDDADSFKDFLLDDAERDDEVATEASPPIATAVEDEDRTEPALAMNTTTETAEHDDLAMMDAPELAPDSQADDLSGDAVDTKLDLARAYIDLDDTEGARAMLREALDEGSQMQKDVAQKLLDSLG